MKSPKLLVLGLLLVGAVLAGFAVPSQAHAYRQRYTSWTYHPTHTYYYRHYHYKPYNSYTGYRHHFCIHYPSRPRYVYYYNPYSRQYWGRYDLESKGYSMLEEKDRSDDLNKIPEAAFPEPGQMPLIPEAKEGETERIAPIAADDLPDVKAPTELPK